MRAQTAGQRLSQALFVGAALGCRNRIAVTGEERFLVERPGHGPFDPAGAIEFGIAAERHGRERLSAFQRRLQKIGEAAGKMQGRLGWRRILGIDQRRVA